MGTTLIGETLPLPFPVAPPRQNDWITDLELFCDFGQKTRSISTEGLTFEGATLSVSTFVNEYWTAHQRAGHSLHEVSYRACFKSQLPRFFIERLTAPGAVVYDPFMGRGTTLLEAALLERIPFGCDLNPLSALLIRPRLRPPTLEQISARLREIPFEDTPEFPEDLLTFYHRETLRQICSLREYFSRRKQTGTFDFVDDWICLVALNRLTGHSPGFFSVYTLPPNQAVSIRAQRKINERCNQIPPSRNVPAIILKKSRSLLADCDPSSRRRLTAAADQAKLLTEAAANTPSLANESVDLVVTSPPFLDVVDYAGDNWLRCWFVGIDPATVAFTVPRQLNRWQQAMTEVFRELHRVLKPAGHVAFEVGEVSRGAVKLEEAVLPCGIAAGLEPQLIVINDQEFTKTANCWGIDNNSKGTNTNRIVVFRKP